MQITVAETVGVEDRGGYYDRSGALRDMVQNHLFQLLALTAMEPPISFSAEAVRDERVKVLHAIHPFTEAGVRSDVVRGQYGPGTWNGTPFPGTVRKRRCHPGRQPRPTSPSGSRSTTGASRACRSTSGPASGCPRACPRSRSSSTGRRCACSSGPAPASLEPNLLLVRIQPNEGISLQFQAKVPGADVRLGTVTMAFNYADYFARVPEPGTKRCSTTA